MFILLFICAAIALYFYPLWIDCSSTWAGCTIYWICSITRVSTLLNFVLVFCALMLFWSVRRRRARDRSRARSLIVDLSSIYRSNCHLFMIFMLLVSVLMWCGKSVPMVVTNILSPSLVLSLPLILSRHICLTGSMIHACTVHPLSFYIKIRLRSCSMLN